MNLGKMFITGANGFIGRRLAEQLREEGVEVAGVDLEPDPDRGVVAGDVATPVTWEDQLDGTDVVFHTAALLSLVGDVDEYWRVNVLGTRRVLEAAARHDVGRVVHLSSIVTFGFAFPDLVDETWPVRPNGSPYVDTKIASEQVCLSAHTAGEIDVTIVRPGDVYGPGSRPWTIEPVEQIKRGLAILPDGGQGIHSPVYVDNLVDGLIAAAQTPEASGRVLIITDGIGIPIIDFFGYYADALGKELRSLPRGVLSPIAKAIETIDRARGRTAEVNPKTVAYLCRTGTYSNRLARELLDWEPKIDLDEGMARTIAWLRETGYL